MLRYWVWGIFSLAIIIGLFAGIVVVFVKHDGQELPQWPSIINHNTLIALMSTLLRESMVVVVAEVIGMSDWNWFTADAKPLQHLQTLRR